MKVYLDNSATTCQYRQVTEYMCKIMSENFGNPSSLHRIGLDAEKVVRESRKKIAGAFGAGENEIFFTSGGSEANNTALFGGASLRRRRGNRIITSKVEHPSVLEAVKKLERESYEIIYLDVDSSGRIDMDQLSDTLNEKTILISIMALNNEIGTIQPIEEIGRIKTEFNKKKGTDILFHVDGVQGFGKYDLSKKGVDMISVSAHKIHGPKGIGALYVRKGLNIHPLILGGGQERGFRAGTENVPAIGGFGMATEKAYDSIEDRIETMRAVRELLKEGIVSEIKDIRINGSHESTNKWRSGCSSIAILNVSFQGVRGEVLLHTLEQDGIYVSTGSACSSNKKGQSHVLKALGLKDRDIEGAIRFSFSEFNTEQEMEYVIGKLKEAVERIRRLGSFR